MTELTVGENLLVDPKQRISFPIIRTERTGRRACNTGLKETTSIVIVSLSSVANLAYGPKGFSRWLDIHIQ
jgi:hypothetical protein